MLEGEEFEKDTYMSLEVGQKKEKQVNTSQGTKVKKRVVGSVRCHQVATYERPENQCCVFSLAILGEASREPRIEVSPQEVKTWMGGC